MTTIKPQFPCWIEGKGWMYYAQPILNRPQSPSTAFAIAVEASYDHMRQHNRTTRNQDDYDAGVKMLVELSKGESHADVELSHVGQIGGKL